MVECQHITSIFQHCFSQNDIIDNNFSQTKNKRIKRYKIQFKNNIWNNIIDCHEHTSALNCKKNEKRLCKMFSACNNYFPIKILIIILILLIWLT